MRRIQALNSVSKLFNLQQPLKTEEQAVYNESMIKQINDNVVKSYIKLEESYNKITDKRQKQFLLVYLRVLDKILDEVVYADERINLIDFQRVKDQKILKYAKKIVKYRQECYKTRQKLVAAKQKLAKEEIITQIMRNENEELQLLCDKKDKEIERIRNDMRKNAIQRQNKSKMEVIAEKLQRQQENPEDVGNIYNTNSLKSTKKQRRFSLQDKKPNPKVLLSRKNYTTIIPKRFQGIEIPKTSSLKHKIVTLTNWTKPYDNEEISTQSIENSNMLGISHKAHKTVQKRENRLNCNELRSKVVDRLHEKIQGLIVKNNYQQFQPYQVVQTQRKYMSIRDNPE